MAQLPVTRRQKFKFWLAGLLGSLLVRLLACTLRVRFFGEDPPPERGPGGKIYCFWHEQLLSLAYVYRKRNIAVMAGRHRDAEYIVRVTDRLGFQAVRGSSTRGGAQAVSDALRKLAQGYDVAITPDGPRGPRQHVKPGALFLAKESGAPLVPGAAVPQKAWRMKSWDRFCIPKPFSRLAVVIGMPIYIPRELGDEEMETRRVELERILKELTEQSEHFFEK